MVGLLWLFVFATPLAVVPGILAAYALVKDATWGRTGLIASAAVDHGIGLVRWAGVVGAPDRSSSLALVVPGVVLLIASVRLRVGRQPLAIDPSPASQFDDEASDPTPVTVTTIADDEALLAYLDAIAHLDGEQMRRLAAAWRAVDPAARERAWGDVRRDLATTGSDRVVEEVREALETWSRASSGSPWTWQFGTMTDVDRGNLRRAAMPALLDGAAAVLGRATLAPEDRDALAGPWLAATDPSMPRAEDLAPS